MKSTVKTSGQQPDMLAAFAAAGKNDGKQPGPGGLNATSETKPIPTDPDQKADAATKVLRAGATNTKQNVKAALQKLPDRTRVQKPK